MFHLTLEAGITKFQVDNFNSNLTSDFWIRKSDTAQRTSKSKMAAWHSNSFENVGYTVYKLFYLICFSSNQCTQYCPTSICGQNTYMHCYQLVFFSISLQWLIWLELLCVFPTCCTEMWSVLSFSRLVEHTIYIFFNCSGPNGNNISYSGYSPFQF